MFYGSGKYPLNFKLGVSLAGYSGLRLSEKYFNSVYVRSAVFSQDKREFILISYDILLLDKNIIKQVNTVLWRKYKINSTNIIHIATHTHSSVTGISSLEGFSKGFEKFCGKCSDGIMKEIINTAVQAVILAKDNLSPAKLSYGEVIVEKVARNRRNTNFSPNYPLSCIKIKTKTDKHILYHYPCHPTVLGPQEHYLSGDYPALVSSKLEEKYRTALFLLGASGDVSIRFNRIFEGIKELERVSDAIVKAVETIKFKSLNSKELNLKIIGNYNIFTIDTWKTDQELDSLINQYKEQSEKADKQEKVLINAQIIGAGVLRNLSDAFKNYKKTPIYLSVFNLANISIVFVGGEPFYFMQQKLSSEFPEQKILLVANAGEYIGYLPNKEAYQKGGYEVEISPYIPGTLESIIDKIIEIKKEIS